MFHIYIYVWCLYLQAESCSEPYQTSKLKPFWIFDKFLHMPPTSTISPINNKTWGHLPSLLPFRWLSVNN